MILQNELESLKNEKRKEIAEKLKEAISYGDLSENSEYQEARDDQAAIEMRISDLEEQLQNYEIVEADHNTAHQLTVNIGNSVVIQKMNGKKPEWDELHFDVVGSTEVDGFSVPLKISGTSPIGRALIGKKEWDIATDDPNNADADKRLPSAPAGSFSYKILKIS